MAASVVGVGVRMVVDGCGAVVVDGGTTVVVTRRSGCGNVVVVVGAANVQPAPNITKTIPARPIRFTTNLHPDPVHWNKRTALSDSSICPFACGIVPVSFRYDSGHVPPRTCPQQPYQAALLDLVVAYCQRCRRRCTGSSHRFWGWLRRIVAHMWWPDHSQYRELSHLHRGEPSPYDRSAGVCVNRPVCPGAA